MKNTHKADATKIVRLQTMSNEDLQKELREAYEKLNFYRSNDLSNYIFGKQAPHANDLEKAVLGACLQDSEAYLIVKDVLEPSDFYSDTHKLIYTVIGKIKDVPTNKADLLTVTNFLMEKNRKELDEFGAYYLVELTNLVASTANIEHHARIIKEKAEKRKLIEIGNYAIKEGYKEEKDIFDLFDEVNARSKANNPNRILRTMKMNDAITIGKKEPVRKCLFGSLLKEQDVTILFSDEGIGKSILAIQMGTAAAKGKALFDMPDIFPNECGPIKVQVCDYELEVRELYDRYSDPENGEAYDFGDNFFRTDMNPEFYDMKNADDKLLKATILEIERNEPQLLIVDNITWLTAESQDAQIATAFMTKILMLQRRMKMTIIVIAHCPKRNTSEPLESKHLSGSTNLKNFAKNLIGVAASKLDPNIRYIKHIKMRNGIKEFGYDNVIQCHIEKEPHSAFLKWKYMDTTPENIHLTFPEMEMTKDEMCKEAIRLQDEEGLSLNAIIKKMNLTCVHTTLSRQIRDFKQKQGNSNPKNDKEFEEFEEFLKSDG
jgi:predicted DNA-binding protein (UPF0251 family)